MSWEPPNEDDFNKKWLTPQRGRTLIEPVYGGPSTTKRWLMSRLKAGLIQAVARTAEFEGKKAPFIAVPRQFWQQCTDWGEDHFWMTGDDEFFDRESRCRMFDIRFDPETIWGNELKEAPSSAIGLAIPARLEDGRKLVSSVSKGGAPRKLWWDDLWIEMIRRIRADTLKPVSVAALQRLMHDWLAEQEIYPGEDTLKKTAIKLFKYLNE